MERRMAEREGFHGPLEFRLSAIESGALRGGTCGAYGEDISSRGLGVLTNYPLRKGMVVCLEMPAAGRSAVPVFAEVKWAEPAIGGIRAGVCFLQ